VSARSPGARSPGRSDDRGNAQRKKARNALAFWPTFKARYAPEVAAAADAAMERLTLRDLRAMEAAELVGLQALLAVTTTHKYRDKIRTAMLQCRKALRALVLAENPSLDLGNLPIQLPDCGSDFDAEVMRSVLDGDEPTTDAWFALGDAERTAKIESFKVDLLKADIANADVHAREGLLEAIAGCEERRSTALAQAAIARAWQADEEGAKAAKAAKKTKKAPQAKKLQTLDADPSG